MNTTKNETHLIELRNLNETYRHRSAQCRALALDLPDNVLMSSTESVCNNALLRMFEHVTLLREAIVAEMQLKGLINPLNQNDNAN